MMFISLPLAGFLIGINYQKVVTETAEEVAKLSCPNPNFVVDRITLNGKEFSKGETFKIPTNNSSAEDAEVTLSAIYEDRF